MRLSLPKIYVVGVGPGAHEWITLKASSLIQSAEYVAGFNSALAVIEHLIRGQTITLEYGNQEAMIQRMLELTIQGHSCVICACGDPNVSDKQLIEKLDSKEVEVEIIPGISSIQGACARLKIPLEETILVTFHKRGSIAEEKQQLREQAKFGQRNVIVLPRPWDFMPSDIAKFLLFEQVDPDREVTILQRVTLENESVLTYTLNELAKEEAPFSDLTVIIIKQSRTDKR